MGTTTANEIAHQNEQEAQARQAANPGSANQKVGSFSPDGRWTHPAQQQSTSAVAQEYEGGYASDEVITGGSMSQLHAAANGNRIGAAEQRRQGGPVEFNHAINYVNKIKNRFSSQPEIYKSFLEILQTYQREQLRIAEVYSQVSVLFKDAPDLLDDFKQFLPDTQPNRGDLSDGAPAGPEQMRLPPVGNFAPPGGNGAPASSTGFAREKRKRAGVTNGSGAAVLEEAPEQFTPGSAQYAMDNIQVSNMRGGSGPMGNGLVVGAAVKRNKREPSPSLIPTTPDALPPPSKISNNYEEITFFDKVKKFLGNKQIYNEFLKLMNLFSQRIIDKNTLVERTEMFIGENRELMDWFKRFVKYEGKPLSIENIPFRKHLLDMNMCRNYGPSYRLIPKRDRWMPCSGRDEMCWEVLNDEWIVHPTWASEDSGVVAHKKNQYEEILYRIEEERHEYDYYIESNLRAIQTLETIANRIANMTAEERAAFKLPPGLGHTSTIYQKVIRKIYDKEKGLEVINAIHENPAVAVPIVLRRMKQKDEEWKRAHREWNKVWRETEQKVFFKSLDHIGLTFKQTDKKMLTTRSLISDITVIKVEQNSKRKTPTAPPPKDQLVYKISDESVLFDTISLLGTYLEHGGSSYSAADKERMLSFYKSFICLFFSIPESAMEKRFNIPVADDNAPNDTNGSDASVVENGTSTPSVNGRKRARDGTGDLLRNVLKKVRSLKGDEDDSDSVASGDESSVVGPSEFVEDSVKLFENESESRWLKHAGAEKVASLFDKESDLQGPRHKSNLFANTTIYVLLRHIETLYERLEEVKGFEDIVHGELERSRSIQFAKDLDLYDKKLEEMGLWFSPNDVYGQTLKICENLITGDLEHQWFEEALRQAFRNRAYRLYTVDKVVQAIAKHIHLIISDQKSADTLVLYQANKAKPTTNLRDQILYRMQVRSVIGTDENMFLIDWDEKTKQLGFQFLGLYSLTLKDVKTQEDQWNYYVTSYIMSVPTEGVPLDKVKPPLLFRSLIAPDEESTSESSFVIVKQDLMARISMNTYKLFFEAGTVDFFTRPADSWTKTRTETSLSQRKSRFETFWDGPEGWESDLEDEEVKKFQEGFEIWKTKGPAEYENWKIEDQRQEEEEEQAAAENSAEDEGKIAEAAEPVNGSENPVESNTEQQDVSDSTAQPRAEEEIRPGIESAPEATATQTDAAVTATAFSAVSGEVPAEVTNDTEPIKAEVPKVNAESVSANADVDMNESANATLDESEAKDDKDVVMDGA